MNKLKVNVQLQKDISDIIVELGQDSLLRVSEAFDIAVFTPGTPFSKSYIMVYESSTIKSVERRARANEIAEEFVQARKAFLSMGFKIRSEHATGINLYPRIAS